MIKIMLGLAEANNCPAICSIEYKERNKTNFIINQVKSSQIKGATLNL
jgi:hypothetical protein